jgi:hypothetical protein
MAGDPTREGWWPTYSSLHPDEAAKLASDYQRNNIASAMMPQQALSGGTVQYSAPHEASSQPLQSDAQYMAMGMSPTDIMLYKQVMAGHQIPIGVYGPYGGGAMGQPQIPSGYNAFSGAGLPPTNIGGGGLASGGYGGSDFFGGGTPQQPQQTPFQQRFQGAPDPSLTGPSETFDTRFPGGGGTSVVPGGGDSGVGGYPRSWMDPNPGS